MSNRIPHDYQGITTGFVGDGVAYPSDQGLFIVPAGGPPDVKDWCPNVRAGSPPATCLAATPLINANGDMSNNIAIKLSVAQGNGTSRYLVTTMWDWCDKTRSPFFESCLHHKKLPTICQDRLRTNIRKSSFKLKEVGAFFAPGDRSLAGMEASHGR